MTALEFKGDRKLLRATLKQKWAQLTDDDLLYAEGALEAFVIRVQLRTGATRRAVDDVFRELEGPAA